VPRAATAQAGGTGGEGEEDGSSPHRRARNRRVSGRAVSRVIEPHRSGSCRGNRQDAAGNHRGMQGRSPQPCRRRPFSAQAGWPHRRALAQQIGSTASASLSSASSPELPKCIAYILSSPCRTSVKKEVIVDKERRVVVVVKRSTKPLVPTPWPH